MGRRFKKKVIPGVEISGIADKGMAVGRDAEGQVIFVEGAVPGDVLDVLAYRKRKGVLFAVPHHFQRYSPDRREPFCAHFDQCGGCKWQHLAYEAQLQHKQRVVEDALQRIAKVEVGEWLPILGSEDTTYYRNKLEFSFSSKRWLTPAEIESGISNAADVLGFHAPGAYDKIVDIQHCWLQPDPSNDLRNAARELAKQQQLAFFDARLKEGFLRNMIVRTSSLGEVMLIVSFFEDDQDRITTYLDALLARFPELTTVIYCINSKANDSMYDLEMRTYYGKGFIEEKLRHVRFRIGPKSFFQTNPRQSELLYETAAEFAGLQGDENVYDLYTGIGSIALFVAGRCRQVVGIEEVEAAIEDARENAKLNGIGNADFYAGDVRDILTAGFAVRHGRPDVLITDPPRAGMHPKVVEMLLQLEAPRLVYVSCNPATQARDLQLLGAKYAVRRVRPVDMFPHTHHVESVALLEKY